MDLKKRFEIGICDINIEPLLEYKEFIESFFMGISIFSEVRSMYMLLDYVGDLLDKCQDVPVWVTVNSPNTDDRIFEKTFRNMISFQSMFPIKGYIVSNVALARIMQSYKIPVRISTVNDVRSIREISWYQENGFKEIVLSYKVNRNLDFIKDAVKTFPDIRFTLVANEMCQSQCPFRTLHFLGASRAHEQVYQCEINNTIGSPSWYLRVLQNSLIPPENIQDYPESIIFKLATRRISDNIFNVQSIVRLLKIYAGLEAYDNIFELMSHHVDINKVRKFKPPKSTIKYWENCKHQCHKCKMCGSLTSARVSCILYLVNHKLLGYTPSRVCFCARRGGKIKLKLPLWWE